MFRRRTKRSQRSSANDSSQNTENSAGNDGIQNSNIELGFPNQAVSMTTESPYTRLQRPFDGYEQLRHPLRERRSEPEYLEPQGDPNGYEEMRDSRRSESGNNNTYNGRVDVFDYSDSIPTHRESGESSLYDRQVEVVNYSNSSPTRRAAVIN